MDLLGLVIYSALTFMAVVGVLAILLPFFVLRIRNELIAANRRLERLIELVESGGPGAPAGTSRGESPPRFCRTCGAANPAGATSCTACRAALG